MQLFISAGLILAIVLWGVVAPASLGGVFETALAAITRNFGWFYLWVVLGLVVMALILAFSRYGDLKLGTEDEEPEFSIGAWFAMLFAAGMGIGLVFWGVAEPVSHYGAPPPGIAPNTPEAANAAMRYSFFHWGLHPWAVYSIVALAIAFFQFRRGGSALVSTAVQSLPWGWARALGPLVNVLAAQAAQLKGDRAQVKRIFEEMTKSPDTEALGLRGLFSEARQAGDDPARTLAKVYRIPELSSDGYYMAFGMHTPDATVTRFRTGLEAIKRNGTLDRLQRKWL